MDDLRTFLLILAAVLVPIFLIGCIGLYRGLKAKDPDEQTHSGIMFFATINLVVLGGVILAIAGFLVWTYLR